MVWKSIVNVHVLTIFIKRKKEAEDIIVKPFFREDDTHLSEAGQFDLKGAPVLSLEKQLVWTKYQKVSFTCTVYDMMLKINAWIKTK